MRSLLLCTAAALVGFGLGRLWTLSPRERNFPPSAELPTTGWPSTSASDPPAQMAISAPPPDLPSEPEFQAEDLKKPLNERISALYKHGDPFGSATRIRAFIATLAAEDFHEFGTKATHLPPREIFGVDPEFSRGVMDALVERWLQVDPAGTLPGIRKLQERFEYAFGDGSPILTLARVRPEVILDDLPENATWSASDRSIPYAFSALGERDSSAARRYLDRCRLPDQRKEAEARIGAGVARRDPLGAVKLAVDTGSPVVLHAALLSASRIGSGMVAQVLDATDGKVKLDGIGDAELIMRHPDLPWASHIEPPSNGNRIASSFIEAATTLTREERDRVLAHADRLPPGFGEQAVAAVVNTWAGEEPQQALEWALNYSMPGETANNRNQPVSLAFSSFLNSNEAAALEWWSSLPASPLKQSLGNRAASVLLTAGKVDQALTLFHPSSDEESARIAMELVEAQSKRDPAEIAAWLDIFPREVNIEQAISSLTRDWLRKDSAAAAAWVESQPEGTRRNQALTAFAKVAADHDPSIAAEWAATITDRTLRQTAVETIYYTIGRRNSVGARHWLRSFTGVDDAWRDRLLRLQQ